MEGSDFRHVVGADRSESRNKGCSHDELTAAFSYYKEPAQLHKKRKWSEMISDHFFSESNFLAKFHGVIDSRTSFGM